MANPIVEKLKELGLRYGDKLAVVVASLVFLLCLAKAIQRPTIEIKPEQIKKYAELSDSNLSRRQAPEEILNILVEQGLKNSHFAKEAEDSAKLLLVADDFKSAREWITPEPGAGLIRDTPELIAPVNVYAYPGRGAALVFALDAEGNRIREAKKAEAPKPTHVRRKKKKRGGGGGMMGGMGGMMGGAKKKKSGTSKSKAELEKEAKDDYDRRQREMRARLAGNDALPDPNEDKKEELPEKEITKGLRWVAITATLDHAQMLANYRKALKNPSIAQPYYWRLDLQRKEQLTDNSWTDWEDVVAKRNLEILNNLPEEDEELTPDNVRPENLNDPLPFLRAGLWEKVHIGSLVPKEKKEVAPPKLPAENEGMAGMMSGMMSGMMQGPGAMGGGNMMSSAMMSSAMMSKMGGMMSGGGMGGMMDAGMMSGMMGGPGGMMNSGPSGVEQLADVWKSEEKKIMVRGLDFTADPDGNYIYRIRIVVVNPNYKREDVSPGVDKEAKELFGPWSEPSNEVLMPPDVSAYAMGTLPGGSKSDMKVVFQVIRFNPEDGVTVPQNFDASPGDLIGEPLRRDVPVSDGTGKKAKLIDFNSHKLVLDVDGGYQAMPSGFNGGSLERPATALLLRPDGLVIAREEADDRLDPVRKDIESNYKREIKDSTKERTNSAGGGYGGMMGGMMEGMMGGGPR